MIKVSYSQWSKAIGDTGCWRRWAFDKIKGIKEPGSAATDKGGLVHEVLERWYRQEDPFPKGKWNKGLTPDESAKVRKFVKVGVEKGILYRHPEQVVEGKFVKAVIPGVEVVGFIDLELPTEIQDHKTSKNRRYMHGSNATLMRDRQLLLYAKVYFDKHEDKDVVVIRHNQFCWDPKEEKDVHTIGTPITRKMAEKNWAKFEEFCKQAKVYHETKELDVLDLPLPEDKGLCRNVFGKTCFYAKYCTKKASVDAPEASVKSILQQAQEMAVSRKAKVSPIDSAPPPTTEQVKLIPMQSLLKSWHAVWAIHDCSVCGGTGWENPDHTGKCQTCVATQKERLEADSANGIRAEHFDDEGMLLAANAKWEPYYSSLKAKRTQEDAPEPTEEAPPPPAPVDEEPPAPVSEEPEYEEVPDEDEPVPEPAKPTPKKTPPKKQTVSKPDGRGRKPGGIILVEGSAIKTKATKVTTLYALWAELTEQAGFTGAEQYFETNAFERRDKVCAQFGRWLEENPGKVVICVSGQPGPDMVPLFNTIAAYATEHYTS